MRPGRRVIARPIRLRQTRVVRPITLVANIPFSAKKALQNPAPTNERKSLRLVRALETPRCLVILGERRRTLPYSMLPEIRINEAVRTWTHALGSADILF